MGYAEDLRTLATRCGVSTFYTGWDSLRHDVSDETLVDVLAALGIAADTEADVAAAEVMLNERPWRAMLPPSLVVIEGQTPTFAVHVPHGDPVTVWVTTESGRSVPAPQRDVWVEPREIDGALVGRATFEVPAGLELGWHTVHASTPAGSHATCTLAVTPPTLTTLPEGQRWGVAVQLYSVRSHASWGVGDLSDLADIADICARRYGADFIQCNPLHSSSSVTPIEKSPYLPTTRRFTNPLYIRLEDIPEASSLPVDDYRAMDRSARRLRRLDDDPNRIRRNRVFKAKMAALQDVFAVPLSPRRQSALDDFLEREGSGLVEFATWCALVERYGTKSPRWDKDFRDPATLESIVATLADRVSFYCWVQWICDQQLEAAQRTAIDAGMAIGIIHDLAVGVQRGGADAWALGHVLADGVTVGAPPDGFNQQGQNWNQPPWHPWHLAEAGYAPFRDMLRTLLRHAGGLRIDHILGLFRLWWIPEGRSAAEGTYVRFDHEALIGVLALEAQRASAVVIGEDLGVFEPSVQEYLAQRGILGTSILWFEHGPYAPIPPEQYRELCLTAVNTHDLPPTAGYLTGEHIRLRAELGLLESDVETEREVDERNRESILDMARDRGLLAEGASLPETVDATYALIARSPSRLLGVALVDTVGEWRIQNQPGTDDSQYPNWCIPLADAAGNVVSVEDLGSNARFDELVKAFLAR